ncbi:hypothetical protein ACWGMA_23030 [Streptomyces asiaticus]
MPASSAGRGQGAGPWSAGKTGTRPDTPGVRFHHMVTVSLGGTGTISHVINNTGGPSNSGNNVANLVNYP